MIVLFRISTVRIESSDSSPSFAAVGGDLEYRQSAKVLAEHTLTLHRNPQQRQRLPFQHTLTRDGEQRYIHIRKTMAATASVGHQPVFDAPSQFRLTQFMSAPQTNAKTSTVDAYLTPTTTRTADVGPIAQATRPPVSSQNNKNLESPRAMAQDHPNSSPHMGLLELVERSSNTSIEGVLGPNKDGRVRNPVPSKLKGKTDTKQGNFGVMHMGQSPGKKTEAQARDNAAERDAAARRTSENTASRAKAAQQDKYMPPKKRGLEATLNDTGSRGSPFAVSKNDDRNRARPLAPDETKVEQARLLTLLRSINPVTVVDQICKAVAYFGGIPGAPPPEDGIFPESANTRETGALFIGWLAEIFPDLSSRSPEVPTKVAAQTGKKKSRPSAAGKKEVETGDNEPPNSRNGYGYGPAISAPAWGLPPSLALVNTPIPVPVAPDGSQGGAVPVYEQSKAVEQLPDTPRKVHYDDPNDTAASKRRRGRPKGSRNKGGKGDGEPESGSNNAEQQASPEMTSDATNTQLPVVGYGVMNQQPSMQKPAQTYQYPAQSWNNTAKSQTGQSMVAPTDDQLSPEEHAVLVAFRHGVDTSINSSAPPVPPTTVPVNNTIGGALPNEKKRKRAPAKPKQIAAPVSSTSVTNPPAEFIQASHNTPILPPTNALNNTMAMGQSQDPIQWTSTATTTTTTPIIPPAKKPRVRKPKAPAPAPAPTPVPTEPPVRNQTASVVSNATPPISASTIPDLQATVPQTSQPVSRPPAEGLEAHYERFAFQQQNGRSNTPTIQPHVQQQQQARQQSKPGSVPPQQSTPQLQHQQLQHHQMQQQKSQQGTQQQSLQKDDHKVTQATSATSSSSRPSSTSYYNNQQRAQPTAYNQQYPTHQPSQLYAGHQATPQLSTNSSATAATNNYNSRTYNSHVLAQASPQFSQSEASYRTASPHTIAQPSPSFSQTETGFRTNSHTITQPTTSYSQPENPYRAPTTHAMAQPTASYAQPRAHAQPQASHQSHYNHFSDSSFIDLPTLESLGHTSNNASSASVGMGVGGYGQSLGVGHSTSRATGGSNNLYGTSSGLSNAYDTSSNDLLRGVSRSGSNPNSGYGTGSSGLSAFDNAGNTEQDLRERLIRGMGRR